MDTNTEMIKVENNSNDLPEILETANKRELLAELTIKIIQRQTLTDEDYTKLDNLLQDCEMYDIRKAKKSCAKCWSKGYTIENNINGLRNDIICKCVILWYTKNGDPNKLYLSEKEFTYLNQIKLKNQYKKQAEQKIEDYEGLKKSDYEVIAQSETEAEIQFTITSEEEKLEKEKFLNRSVNDKENNKIGSIIDFEQISDTEAVLTALIEKQYLNN